MLTGTRFQLLLSFVAKNRNLGRARVTGFRCVCPERLVDQGLLQRIKSQLNKNYNYYLKEEINNILNEFYVESK